MRLTTCSPKLHIVEGKRMYPQPPGPLSYFFVQRREQINIKSIPDHTCTWSIYQFGQEPVTVHVYGVMMVDCDCTIPCACIWCNDGRL